MMTNSAKAIASRASPGDRQGIREACVGQKPHVPPCGVELGGFLPSAGQKPHQSSISRPG